jgi:hypothetical protein
MIINYSNIPQLISSTFANGSSGQNITPNINTIGAKIIVIGVDCYGLASTPVITDSKGNIWIQLNRKQGDINIAASIIFYCINPITGTNHNFTSTEVSSYPGIQVMAFSGGNYIFDSQNGTGGDGINNIQPGPVISSKGNNLIVTCVNPWTLTPSINNNFKTIGIHDFIGGSQFAGGSAYLVTNEILPINPIWLWNGVSGDSSSVIALFKSN